ncbi:ATP-binding protein [Halopenitus sp. H-Gu1]|uniref:sensor histidine kinase n=1 Tax=Halopenitus sp. H-Gu1 TaxID=3242697 RepID=UPI00359D6427
MKNDKMDKSRVAPDDPDLLLQLMESTNDCLWMFTPDWEELIFANSAYEDIFGRSVTELKEDPENFVEAIHPNDRQTVMGQMAELSNGNPIDLEFRVNPEVDYETWVWVQGEPVHTETGEVEYVAGYTRDISERKDYQQKLEQHREELEQSNESLREFAYIASHDLQEPLRMVSSYVELLDQEYGEQFDDEAEEYMQFAVNGAQRMKQMINSLLEYSRVHTDAKEFDETDVNEVFQTSRQDLELLIDDHDAEISVGDLPIVRADREQLGQVFQNLIKNAIEHATENGIPKIEVTATERDDAYEFAVSDNGPGVPINEQEEIFKIFQQGASASNTANSGIGLAITQRIVQRHGGTIWVESEHDSGATFKFTIPKVSPIAMQEEEEQP